MSLKQKVKKEQIDWAYEVLDSLKAGADAVLAKPELAGQFVVEVVAKLPDIFDAVMILTVPEHRQVVAEVMKSLAEVVKVWAESKVY